MKIFLDTAHVPTIKQWYAMGIIDGITTNPSLLVKEKRDPWTIVKEICAIVTEGDISVEVTERDSEKIYSQAHTIARIAPSVVVKVPCHSAYYSVIQRLVREGIAINVTLVFTLAQALMMSKLGVKYISPFLGRLEDIDASGIQLLTDIRDMIDQYGFSTKILAASLRSVFHVHTAILSGADIATMPAEVLEKIVVHPLTDSGIERFLSDWQKGCCSQAIE